MTAIGLAELLELEAAVWRALVDGDPAADAALLADDFLGVYPTGCTGRDDHAGQLRDGPTVTSFELSEARATTVSSDSVLLTYRADYRRPATAAETDAETDVEAMYVTSLWCRRDGRWLNVFSQDTPVGPALP